MAGGKAGVAETEGGALTSADLDAFCVREYRWLVGLLGLYCGDADVGEELAQEALVRLCRNWDRLPTEADAKRWLTRVALNLAKSRMRSRAVRQRILDRYGHTLVRRDPSTDEARVFAVRAAVAGLPDRQRRVVILRYFCDLSVADVAVLMECPSGTVKSLTSIAIAALRRTGLEVTDD